MINIKKEELYLLEVDKEKQKKYGQYFTPPEIADVMAKWVGKRAITALDPAYGNGIFFRYMKKYYKDISYTGFEIDKEMAQYFEIPQGDDIYFEDFLTTDFTKKYDAIICNPPYNKFQTIDNRKDIKSHFYISTGITMNGYTNQYIYFLIKCIYQLNQNGRLAFIVPIEFLNSKYGEQIKKILIEKRLLKSIINLNFEVFKSALTTSCILLIEKKNNKFVEFLNIEDKEELLNIDFDINSSTSSKTIVTYEDLRCNKSWGKYLYNTEVLSTKLANLTTLNTFAKVSRGLVTGCNEFFLLNQEQVEKYELEQKYLTLCVSKSNYIKTPIFGELEMSELIKTNKKVFLLDIKDAPNTKLKIYIEEGVKNGFSRRYVTKKRTPWYSMEQKNGGSILLSSAFRGNFKVIKNRNLYKNLTTFHSLNLNSEYKEYENILFCYLLTDIGQRLIMENKKIMGGGLNKFQPNDYNTAKLIDLRLLTEREKRRIEALYNDLILKYSDEKVKMCENIFLQYIV